MYKPKWHLKGKPYAVQLEGLRRSFGRDRFGFFFEMGLGKTALQLNDYIENFSNLDTIVVLSPNTFKTDWAFAPTEWGLEGVDCCVWPNEFVKGKTSKPVLNIMNYEAVRTPRGYNVVKTIFDSRPCLLVVDESSFIKNFKSDTAKAVLDLSKRAKGVRLLNGTPLVQNVMDVYPQLKCLGELDGVNPYAFRNKFAIMGGFMGKQITGVQNETELHTILNRCSMRALKQDWSDLPEKIYIPLRLEMTNKQQKLYREMMEDFYTLVEGKEFSANMVIGQLDKLRQIASGLLMDGDQFVLIEEPKNNPKIKAALDLLEGPGKMIIIYFYRKMGAAIFDEMKRKKLNPAYIRGGMAQDEITEQKAKFNTDPSCRVLVGQITATRMSHTLLGGEGNDRCHKTFMHDQTFSLLDRKQVEDRNHRGAQDKAVLYYDPIMSPIDQAQLDALQKKQDMATAVVDAVRALRRKK